MHETDREALVRDTMLRFARKTGLSPRADRPVRYLWTDAYAVCNFLELYHLTSDGKYLELALDLVEQVHEALGKHREDDKRAGWISGLSEDEGRMHPTAGGLRIGKSLPDRKPYEPEDASLEWERDGQYFHYLTKWMHALRQVGIAARDGKYVLWAGELGKAACQTFTRRSADGSTTGIYWKMSVDLTYPVVSTMGHHDPLDGYLSLLEIDQSLPQVDRNLPSLDLSSEIDNLRLLCSDRDWVTDDPLGVGGLLFDAGRLMQLPNGSDREFNTTMLTSLLEASLTGLRHFLRSGSLQENAAERLAFRELGLAIGLHAVPLMQERARKHSGSRGCRLVAELEKIAPLAQEIENFWLHSAHRQARSWRDHENINMVMLASSLMPEGVLKP